MTINALHLLWIVPLSAILGYFMCAMLIVGNNGDDEEEEGD